jgi:hypothetical protein
VAQSAGIVRRIPVANKQRLLVAVITPIGKPPERSRVFTICFLWMAPGLKRVAPRQTGW